MKLADVERDLRDDILFVKLSGEIDMSNADQLRRGLASMTPNNALGLVLDLADVDYLDSAGIHLVYRLRESLRTRGQDLKLVIPADSVVNDTLRLAGVERGKDIVDSVDAARQALTSGRPSAPRSS